MPELPLTFVLVHGAWHDHWCWEPVVRLLEQAGHRVVALDLPLTGSDRDVQAVEAALAAEEAPIVLVGHSYGGRVISEAASGNRDVAHLVFVCAFALKQNEENADGLADVSPISIGDQIRIEGEQVLVGTEKAVESFYAQCPKELADEAISRLRPMSIHGFSERRPAAWESIPSTYVVCSEDRALHPRVQMGMAERCSYREVLKTDHSPFLSDPEGLAGILLAVPVGP